jgi:hypothetical protein
MPDDKLPAKQAHGPTHRFVFDPRGRTDPRSIGLIRSRYDLHGKVLVQPLIVAADHPSAHDVLNKGDEIEVEENDWAMLDFVENRNKHLFRWAGCSQPSPAPDQARQDRRGSPLPKEPASQVTKGSVSSRKKRGSYNSRQRLRARKVLQRMFGDKEYPAKDDDTVDIDDLKNRFHDTYNAMVSAGQLSRVKGGAPSWSTVERELGWKDTEQ